MPTIRLSDSQLNDRGSRVLTTGLQLDRFLANPIMLWMHMRDGDLLNLRETLPIGHWTNVRIENDELLGEPVFDTDEFAQTIKAKVDSGTIRAASIGARIIELSDSKEDVLPGQTRATIKRAELLEVSLVDIPANARALRLYSAENVTLSAKQLETEIPKLNLMSEPTLTDNAMFDKLRKMFGLKTVEEQEVEKLKGVEVENQSLRLQIQNSENENVALKTETTQLKADVVSKDAEIAALKSEVEKLKTLPGAESPKAYEPAAPTSADETFNDNMSFLEKLNALEAMYF